MLTNGKFASEFVRTNSRKAFGFSRIYSPPATNRCGWSDGYSEFPEWEVAHVPTDNRGAKSERLRNGRGAVFHSSREKLKLK
ncbi:hypothetical protein GWI33_016185 [Rhynchophorus ferrugineus]|uniref:Uncharacterized protein n=1 Tax=Rhynchophorus ferrugineus TaxID=354439 RepID=A0A834M577_RHYFE|nr:hypothetical protein GWI33_016185 [Rhynchophorus ferrugineus]